jgi:sugar O-acyltransferase (sialic acid O-acetyltransferase NeuD family)
MSMKNIYLFGYSGHALVVNDCASHAYSVIGYFDRKENSSNPLGIIFLGDERTTDLHQYRDQGFVFPSVGKNTSRKNLRELFIENGLRETVLIHPSSFVSTNAIIGLSTMIGPNAVVNAFAQIGNGVIINSGAIVEHECLVGDCCHIAPGAVIAGNVEIGEGSFIGANSVVKEGVRIGKNVVIGAGSAVLTDIPDNELWAGVPAIKKKSVEE